MISANDVRQPRRRTARAAGARVWLGSALFAIGLTATTIVFAPLSLLCFPLPLHRRYDFITRWTRINLWWLKHTCGLDHVVEGADNIPVKAAIVLCKHQSVWETLALQLLFRPQVWVLKRELLRIPFFGWGLAMLRPIAIDRGAGKRAMEQVVEQGGDRLAKGCFVVVFPEGTRVPPGERRRYKRGGAVLAEHTGRDVVPVAVNSGEFWPRNSFLKYPGRIRLVIGAPIPVAGLAADEINRRAEDWIEQTVSRISERPLAPPPDAASSETGQETA